MRTLKEIKSTFANRFRNELLETSSLSLFLSTILIFALKYGHSQTELGNPYLQRFFVLLGGDIVNGGYIQWGTYFAFFWCQFDVLKLLRRIKKEREAFWEIDIPRGVGNKLFARDIKALFLQTMHRKNGDLTLLDDLVHKASHKFINSKSISETRETISIQVEINKEKSESQYSNLRYLTWAIPSIGFIGTVIGISRALAIAHIGRIELVTATLGMAFDTTLVALVLSLIVMYYYHYLEEQTDRLHAEMREFVMDKLINRME